ncbi:CDP-glycerol glycerophosphotransferase family protein [Lacticaseibacillus parakribbianus]|uniref:CDP-glycerol glycerophosphotransferase family protein n=1 Tax=Lacticaseibacillus parakribbianus TaxID=2970927 RepID=UPI0021CB2FDD|nr:CDP-glycerol glycerophosphotransferase family protein [Lacticaseibacillus parakribbianus]
MNLVNRVSRVLKQREDQAYQYTYLKAYKKHTLMRDVALIESTHGDNFYGHMYYVTRELARQYPNLTINVAVAPELVASVQAILTRDGLSGVTLVPYLSDRYCQLLASAEYLFNDTSYYSFFIKQDFQKYFNIWHGTPLKCLGKDDGDVARMGNVQRNFYSADALVVSNDYTRDKMIGSFNLDRVMRGDVVVGPSPRNSVLSDATVRAAVRQRYNLGEREALVYMPTWRENDGEVDADATFTTRLLAKLDAALSDSQVLFVKLHPFQAKLTQLDFADYHHIEAFPSDIESYQFLAGTDGLITDYSSIMYDYMNTGKPVVLFAYDKAAYYASRGCYEDIDDYPFTQVHSTKRLIDWLQVADHAVDYDAAFAKRYVGVDSTAGTGELVYYLMSHYGHAEAHGEQPHVSAKSPYNGLPTVAIYSGGLWNNGITSALLNTLDQVDLTKHNYVVFFPKATVKPAFRFLLFNLPKGVVFFPFDGGSTGSTFERFMMRRYIRSEHFNFAPFRTATDAVYRREYDRILGALKPAYFIHYTGFERAYSEMIASLAKRPVKTMVYVHTDIFQERELRGSAMNWKMTKRAYQYADRIVLVSDQLKADFIHHFPSFAPRVRIMNNFLGSQKVKKMGDESVFTTILNTPVTASNDYAVKRQAINAIGSRRIDFAVPPADEFVTNALLTRYHELNTFPFVEKSLPDIVAAWNEKLADYVNVAHPLQPDVSQIFTMYGTSKLRLLDDLLNPDIKVFVNVGRMAAQKGQDRLIQSFAEVHRRYPNTRLVIIAPHGTLRRQTLGWIRDSGCSSSIYLLGGMDNPYALMKLTDAFVFTSRYEGLGLVVFEALALDLDVITVEIPATVAMLKPGNALVAKNTDADITAKWLAYMAKGFKRTPYDFAVQDARSKQEFESLFE